MLKVYFIILLSFIGLISVPAKALDAKNVAVCENLSVSKPTQNQIVCDCIFSSIEKLNLGEEQILAEKVMMKWLIWYRDMSSKFDDEEDWDTNEIGLSLMRLVVEERYNWEDVEKTQNKILYLVSRKQCDIPSIF